MATELVPHPPQTRAEFGVGASIAAAAIGVGDYGGPVDAWLVCTGRKAPFAGNEKTRWGEALEPVIRAHYVEKNRATVYVPPTSLFHEELPFVRATPDGIVLDVAGKWSYVGPQVKNVGARMAPLWDDGATPPDYFIQGVVEMAVTKLPRIDFAVLIGGQEFREVTIWRDAELEAQTLEQLAGFWKLVETDTQPAINESKALKAYLLRQINRTATIKATDADVELLEEWRRIARSIKAAKKAEKIVRNKVIARMAVANATKLVTDDKELGAISIGGKFRNTKWASVAEELRFHGAALLQVERELIALRAQIADPPPAEYNAIDREALVARIDALRANCRLAAGAETFDEIVARYTKHGDPVVRRPNGWTKDTDEETDHEEN